MAGSGIRVYFTKILTGSQDSAPKGQPAKTGEISVLSSPKESTIEYSTYKDTSDGFNPPKKYRSVKKDIHKCPVEALPDPSDNVCEVRFFLYKLLTYKPYGIACSWPQWVLETVGAWHGTGADFHSTSDFEKLCPLSPGHWTIEERKIEAYPSAKCRACIGKAIGAAVKTLEDKQEGSEATRRRTKSMRRRDRTGSERSHSRSGTRSSTKTESVELVKEDCLEVAPLTCCTPRMNAKPSSIVTNTLPTEDSTVSYGEEGSEQIEQDPYDQVISALGLTHWSQDHASQSLVCAHQTQLAETPIVLDTLPQDNLSNETLTVPFASPKNGETCSNGEVESPTRDSLLASSPDHGSQGSSTPKRWPSPRSSTSLQTKRLSCPAESQLARSMCTDVSSATLPLKANPGHPTEIQNVEERRPTIATSGFGRSTQADSNPGIAQHRMTPSYTRRSASVTPGLSRRSEAMGSDRTQAQYAQQDGISSQIMANPCNSSSALSASQYAASEGYRSPDRGRNSVDSESGDAARRYRPSSLNVVPVPLVQLPETHRFAFEQAESIRSRSPPVYASSQVSSRLSERSYRSKLSRMHSNRDTGMLGPSHRIINPATGRPFATLIEAIEEREVLGVGVFSPTMVA